MICSGYLSQGFNARHRCEQGSNLRGETPLDFKSNALTTRPSQLELSSFIVYNFS